VEIFRTRIFEQSLKALGATDAELAALEAAIMMNPEAGDVIKGLGGARKIRFGMGGKGKSGGGRAIYVVIRVRDTAYLLLAYAKSDQEEISNDQRKAIRALIEVIKE
jgi:hypothetical protein